MKNGKIGVLLIDYDVCIEANLESLLKLNPKLSIQLAFIDDQKKDKKDRKYIEELTMNKVLYMYLIEKCQENVKVLLLDQPSLLEANSLNEMLLLSTSVKYMDIERTTTTDDLKQVINELKEIAHQTNGVP